MIYGLLMYGEIFAHFLIYSIRKPFLMHGFATAPLWSSLDEENLIFFFNQCIRLGTENGKNERQPTHRQSTTNTWPPTADTRQPGTNNNHRQPTHDNQERTTTTDSRHTTTRNHNNRRQPTTRNQQQPQRHLTIYRQHSTIDTRQPITKNYHR